MKSVTTQGIELIKRFEGFRACVYTCSAGFKTIGYGHRILPTENYRTISVMLAEQILKKDLSICAAAITKLINVNLQHYQFDALASFTYNLGTAALQRSSLRQKINFGALSEAQDEFLKWVYVGQKKINGLIIRRRIESRLFAGELCC